MRRWNGILSAAILILFLVHGVLGAFQLAGAGNVISGRISYLLLTLIAVHAVIGIVLTAQTLRIRSKGGAGYFRQNLRFVSVRVSGFLIMGLIAFHMTAFSDRSAPAYRLKEFTQLRLFAQLLLAAAVAVHVIANVRPMLITFGIRGIRRWAAEILFVLTVLLCVMAAAFVIYYLRWQ